MGKYVCKYAHNGDVADDARLALPRPFRPSPRGKHHAHGHTVLPELGSMEALAVRCRSETWQRVGVAGRELGRFDRRRMVEKDEAAFAGRKFCSLEGW